MGNGAIGVPDVNQLPIQSDVSQYNLRNAAAAMTPVPTAPPGAIGTPALGSTEDLQQRSLESFQNPGQYVPEVPQEFQQPQFLPPQQADPLEGAKQTILARLQDRQAQNMQRGSRIKNMLTNFLHGAGEAMMVHSGLPTPEMQHQRDLQNLLDISNAQANQGLKDVEAQRYMLDVQKVPVLDSNGQPLRDAGGNVQLYPRWQAAIQQQHVNKLAEQRPPKVELNELYASSVQDDLAKGLRGPSPRTLQLRDSIQAAQKPPADISPDRETFNYYTRPKEQGGLGLSPAQAYSAMHPRQNLTMGSTDVKDIADAIESGDQPPTLTGLYRNAAPVRAELARRGVPIARMEMDWKATQKYMGTLNGPQQVRLRQAIETAGDSLDKIQGLYDEWQKLAPVSGFKIANHAALVAMKNLPGRAGAVANSLDAQIADLTSELGNVYMGGNSPTDHSLKLAQQNLSSDWGPDAFEEAMKQARLNIGIRKNSITHGAPAGVSGENTYMPPQPAAPPIPAGGGGPPPGATHTAQASDGKRHYTNAQGQDLGGVP